MLSTLRRLCGGLDVLFPRKCNRPEQWIGAVLTEGRILGGGVERETYKGGGSERERLALTLFIVSHRQQDVRV